MFSNNLSNNVFWLPTRTALILLAVILVLSPLTTLAFNDGNLKVQLKNSPLNIDLNSYPSIDLSKVPNEKKQEVAKILETLQKGQYIFNVYQGKERTNYEQLISLAADIIGNEVNPGIGSRVLDTLTSVVDERAYGVADKFNTLKNVGLIAGMVQAMQNKKEEDAIFWYISYRDAHRNEGDEGAWNKITGIYESDEYKLAGQDIFKQFDKDKLHQAANTAYDAYELASAINTDRTAQDNLKKQIINDLEQQVPEQKPSFLANLLSTVSGFVKTAAQNAAQVFTNITKTPAVPTDTKNNNSPASIGEAVLRLIGGTEATVSLPTQSQVQTPQTRLNQDITAFVIDQYGNPVSNAYFWMVSDQGKTFPANYKLNTNISGRLEFTAGTMGVSEIPVGRYTLHLSKDGYEDPRQSIQFSLGQTSLGKIVMNKLQNEQSLPTKPRSTEQTQQLPVVQKETQSKTENKVSETPPSAVSQTQTMPQTPPPTAASPVAPVSEPQPAHTSPAQIVNPQLLNTPVSAPKGTRIFIEGTYFTPNGGITESITKPSGETYISARYQADSNGRYSNNYDSNVFSAFGTYTLYWVDDATGKKSNTVSETVQADNASPVQTSNSELLQYKNFDLVVHQIRKTDGLETTTSYQYRDGRGLLLVDIEWLINEAKQSGWKYEIVPVQPAS